MAWIHSMLRVLCGFFERGARWTLLPLVLLISCALSGAACRGDDTIAPAGVAVALDDSDASPIAGTIQGSYAVSSTGEATYTLPIVVPPGAAGIQPSLAITYDSASGDGMLGVGFSLTGLSAIARCPLTIAQDGQIRGVRYDQLDGLCLDGARLIPVGSSNGIVEYRTFPDTFVKVFALPSKVAANPAETLKVFARSGLILEYGTSPDSKVMARSGVIRSWLVKRVSDRSENTIDYEYLNLTTGHENTTEYVPFRIRYTGNKGVLPSRTVQFAYEAKTESDARTFFAGGMALMSTQQLTTISMYGPENSLVREYQLTYKPGAGSGRTVLRSIRECAADGTCKPRTTFAWYGGTADFERIATTIDVPQSHLSAPMMMDVTGDGLDDLVVPTVPWDAAAHSDVPTTDWTITPNAGSSPSTGAAYFQASGVAYSEDNNDSTNDPVLQKQPDLKVQSDYGTPIDYNQDGLMDVLVHNVHETAFSFANTWGVLLATPQHKFKLLDTGIPRPKHLVDGTLKLNNKEASVHLADVNGDGVADLIQCERDPSAGGGDAFRWTLRLWTPAGPGFEQVARQMAKPAENLNLFHCAWDIHPADLDADGKTDLVFAEIGDDGRSPREDHLSMSYDEHADAWSTEKIGNLGTASTSYLFLDVNGDGLPDVVKIEPISGQPVTYLNTGDSHGHRFAAGVLSVGSYIPGSLAALWDLAAVLDYNGDGRQDVLVPITEEDGLVSWLILRATGKAGEGTFELVKVKIPFEAELSQQGVTISNRLGPRVTDVDGDGSPDIVLPIGNHFTIFRATGTQQDLLASVHDGLNAHDPQDPENVPTVAFTYGSLVDSGTADDDSDYLSKGWFAPDCAYPLRCVVGSRRVVREVEVNNGADKARRSRIQYRGGRFDRRGRGFLGFHSKITTDLDTGSGSIAIYGDAAEVDVGSVKTYPEAGELREEIRWTPNPRPQDPRRVELSFATIKRQLRATNGVATYFLMPTDVAQAREQGQFDPAGPQSLHAWLQLSAKGSSASVSGSDVTTTAYDDFGNVLASVTTADGVDLTTTISDVKFNNLAGSWLIGQLATRTECSAAASVKQCRTITRTYYDTTGLLKDEIVDAEGDATMHLTITYGRDAFGNVTTTTADDLLGNHRASSTTYEPSGVFPSQHMNAVGHVVVPAFDAGLGVMLSLVDENQLTTTWKYDGFGRRILETRPDLTETVRTLVRAKDGGPKQNEWNVKVTTTTEGGEDSAVQYDSLARPIRWWTHGTQTGHDPPARLMQEIVFDELGEHVARRSLPVNEATPPEGRHYDDYAYDPAGRVLTHTSPWKAKTTYEYEVRDVVVTDPLDQITTEESDGLGRLIKVTDAKTGITSYTYGPFGALSTVTDPGNAVTSTQRDAYGRVRTVTEPDKGTTTLEYDGFNEVVSSLDANGRTSKSFYDPLGRRTRREDSASPPNSPVEATTWKWDTALLGTGGQLALGALAEVDGPDGTATLYTYDALGRLDATERSIAGETFGTTNTYDKLGHLATVTYPEAKGFSPFTVQNEYDPYGHLLKVWDPANKSAESTSYWRLAETDSADRITAESLGNGFTTTRSYFDDKSSLKSIRTAKDAAPPVQDLAYDYDAKLNLATRHDALQTQNTTEFFQYDALDRLTCASFANTPACAKANRYTYAPNGNLLTKPGIAGAYAYDANHPHAVQTAGADSFAYDLVGNQITRSGASVSYTPFDMPKAFTPAPGQGGVPVTLDYDGDQQRVRKTAGSDVTVYVSDLYERTTNTATNAVEHRYFVYSSERVVAVVTRDAATSPQQKTRYLHVDNLGSVETVTDETGSKPAEKRSYDAFGARRNPSWGAAPIAFASKTTRGFTGHEDDEELGLVNMKGRLYDPKVGRFLTGDPIVSHPAYGQSWNPYSYVLNNPLAFTDPSGFEGTGDKTTEGPTIIRTLSVPTAQEIADAKAAQERADAQIAREWYVPLPPDMAATGTTAGPVSQPTADGTPPGMASRANQTRRPSPAGFDPSFGKSSVEIAADFARGTKDGIVDLAADAARFDLLHVPRGLARLVRSAWESEGGLSGLASVVLEPGREQVATAVDRAGEGDFRGAAAAGVKAISVGVTTGIAVGELGAAAVNAVDAAGPEKGGSGEPSRAGKSFTPKGRQDIDATNAERNNGVNKCENCGVEVVPGRRNERGVAPPPNQRERDHIVPKSKGGNGAPSNGQVLCRTCNNVKSDR
jgi:RHS repeat-associated protein